MTALDRLGQGLDSMARTLDSPDLEPGPEAVDWSERDADLSSLKATLVDVIFAELPGAGDDLVDLVADPDERAIQQDNLSLEAAMLSAELSVLFWLARDEATAGELFAKAVDRAPSGPIKEELEAGQRELAAYAQLSHARWLMRQGLTDDADKVLKELNKSVESPVLKASVKKALNRPRPLKGGAPSLSTLNGIGFGLYGERDRWPDDTYVATHCFCVLFIPIIPIAAYRVFNQGGGQFTFYAREPLSAFARGYRWFLAAAVVVGVVGALLASWLDSPGRRAGIELADARAAHEAGRHAEALRGYEELLRNYGGSIPDSTLAPAAVGIMALTLAKVPEPMALEHVDQASRVVVRYQDLPSGLQRGEPSKQLTAALLRWTEQVGDADIAHGEAGLRLLGLAEDVAAQAETAAVKRRRQTLERTVADRLAPDWPMDALAHYVAAGGGDKALAASSDTVRLIARSPSLLIEAEPLLTTWLSDATAAGGDKSLASEVREKLQRAREHMSDPGRQKALESADEALLQQALAGSPGDHEVAAALAEVKRSTGDIQGALALFQKLGPPGHLSSTAQRTLAGCLADNGRLEEADTILDRYVSKRMPAFQKARRDYDAAVKTSIESFQRRLRNGDLPPALEAELLSAGESQQQAIVERYVRSRLDNDPTLTNLRSRYERLGRVVPSALSLGMIKLRRANESTGDSRSELLAAAERLFLSIREEAEGVPSYHLGLGQVYHRLGRAEEGERELTSMLARGQPELSLAVARAYRELGLVARAREVAQGVYDGGEVEGATVRGDSAVLMALLADRLEDEELWLKRAPQDQHFVRTTLLGVRAQRLYRDGQIERAGRLFDEVAREHGRDEGHSAAAANNAALARQSQYLCTGVPGHLELAVEGLEKALRMAPDSALTTGNLAQVHEYQAQVKTLESWVRTGTLRLDQSQSGSVIGVLADGPQREQLVEALRRDPSMRRAQELGRQEQVLAPGRIMAYLRELGWHELADDAEALRALQARVAHVSSFDTTRIDELRQRWASGVDDGQRRRDVDAAITAADVMLTRARSARHQPTLAAALVVRASALRARARLGDGLDDAQAAVAALREARRAWPEMGVESTLAWALVDVALYRAMAECRPLAAAWREEGRTYSVSVMLHRAATGASGAEITAALRRTSELSEAATLIGGQESRPWTLGDWILGRLADDAALQSAAAPAPTRETLRLSTEIVHRINPNDPNATYRLTLLQSP